jgi:alanine dehydrogenase
MLILSNEEIEQLLSMRDCLAILEQAYRDDAAGQTLTLPRVDNMVPCSYEGGYYAFKHMGGIWPRRRVLALRTNSDVITNPLVDGKPRRVKVPLAGGRWVGLIQLYSTETGELLALLPDGVIQRTRVGVASALGTRYLARRDARRVGLIGAGWQAGGQVLALLAERPIDEIKVYSLHEAGRKAFAREMRDKTGANIRAVDSVDECVREVDIIQCATSALVPVVRPEWLRAGIHVGCIKNHEVDDSVLERCDRIGVHNKREIKEEDNILAGTPNVPTQMHEGWWMQQDRWKSFVGLADLIVGRAPGRSNDDQITCFVNNLGLGLQFAAIGALVLEQARRSGVGRELPGEWFSETVHP